MSDPTFTMECRCGRSQSFESTLERLECDCGAVYAVTITELRAPRDGSEPSSEG
jgi:hypothetical protein